MWEEAMVVNLDNIVRRIAGVGGKLLDVGCDDGARTLAFARASGAEPHGLDIVRERVDEARARGVHAQVADLNDRFPYEAATFDLVVSNQVIEHLTDTDRFVSETHRVLRPGGLAVVSTENLASWHNIGALVLGWQPFSLTNVSEARAGLGNPLALHRDEQPAHPAWEHRRVFGYRGLIELFVAHGFRDVVADGAGMYPFPARLGRRLPRHAAFLTVSARR
jgi:SAM-dependent methyltransferase